MKGVDTIARVRREHLVRGKTIKEIARDLHLSRNTVRKILRSGATSFEDERQVQPQPKLGPWRGELDKLLAANAARPNREWLTLMRLFEELRGRGYDVVRRYAARWRRRQSGSTAMAFVRLSFAPGEAYLRVSHEVVVINGVTTIAKVAHMRLCHSQCGGDLCGSTRPHRANGRIVVERTWRLSRLGASSRWRVGAQSNR
jgi:hypothetical protein